MGRKILVFCTSAIGVFVGVTVAVTVCLAANMAGLIIGGHTDPTLSNKNDVAYGLIFTLGTLLGIAAGIYLWYRISRAQW